jgi:hypothetical protein
LPQAKNEGNSSIQPSSLAAPNSKYVPPHATVQTVKSRQTSTSEAQFSANRANAQLSTGPRTEAGKRIASLNAVKTDLTGRTVGSDKRWKA